MSKDKIKEKDIAILILLFMTIASIGLLIHRTNQPNEIDQELMRRQWLDGLDTCKLDIYKSTYGITLLPVQIYNITSYDDTGRVKGDCQRLREVCERNQNDPLNCFWFPSENLCECVVS